MDKQRGMILLIVMIFSQIFGLLGLHMLQMNLFTAKQSQAEWHKQEALNMANNVLLTIEKLLPSVCQIKITPVATLRDYPLAWWQERAACADNKGSFHFFYAIEHLGEDPCGSLQETPRLIANYFRITLIGQLGNATVRLQSTIVRPIENKTLKCKETYHIILPARQMQREID